MHKPYNFKRTTVSIEEREKEIHNVEREIGYQFPTIIRTQQTHSNNVKVINEENIDEKIENTDGLITNLKDVALFSLIADCQGILLYDPKKNIIGNIHSGWRGTLSRISTNALNIMRQQFNSDPVDIKVYFSPSIHQCCFEVGEEVKTLFEKEFKEINLKDIIKGWECKDHDQKYFIDMVELNKRVLLDLWIKKENLLISDECTVCNSDKFHSYRKDKPHEWRNLLIIALKNISWK